MDILKNKTFYKVNSLKNPTSFQWKENGSLIGISGNNKINIIDPRINQKVIIFKTNEKLQNLKFTSIGKELIATTELDQSYNKLKLWDIKNNQSFYESFIENDKFEKTPFCDKESQLIYTIGKRDIKTNVCEHSTGRIRKITDFPSSEPSLCSMLFERKCLDYYHHEIERFARFTSKNNICYVNFFKNRFDKNLYPFIEYGEPIIESELCIKGESAQPIQKEINYSELA